MPTDPPHVYVGDDNLFVRIAKAVAQLDNRDWLAQKFHGDESLAVKFLEDKYFPDLASAMPLTLLHNIYRAFPDEQVWRDCKYNLRYMRVKLDEVYAEEKARAREMRGIPEKRAGKLWLKQITVDPTIQCRAAMDPATVGEYQAALIDGQKLPPIVVFEEGGTYWLADGFHRYQAHQRSCIDEVKVQIIKGDRRAALLYAAGANTTHGLKRNSADKERAVRAVLADGEYRRMSDRWIAEQVKVDHKTVARIRALVDAEKPPTGEILSCGDMPRRVGKDGKKRSLPKTKESPATVEQEQEGGFVDSDVYNRDVKKLQELKAELAALRQRRRQEGDNEKVKLQEEQAALLAESKALNERLDRLVGQMPDSDDVIQFSGSEGPEASVTVNRLPSIQLLPAEGYALHLSGDVDGERFASIFRRTWPRLPPGARHACIARWWYAAQRTRPPDVPTCPYFVLAANLTNPGYGSVAGLYVDRLNVFAWHGPTVDALPDDLVAAAIAHELGHAVVAEVSYGEHTHEWTIDALVEDWGFEGHELRSMCRPERAASANC